ERDRATHAAADQDAGAQPERLQHPEDHRRTVLDRRRAVDPARAPMPGEIDGDEAVVRREAGELPPPDAGIAARGVQEHEERAAVERGRNVGQGGRTRVQVVDGRAVDVDVLRVQGDPGYDAVARGVKFRKNSPTRGASPGSEGCSSSTSSRPHRHSPAAVRTITSVDSASTSQTTSLPFPSYHRAFSRSQVSPPRSPLTWTASTGAPRAKPGDDWSRSLAWNTARSGARTSPSSRSPASFVPPRNSGCS